nr:energy-coupling factor transporter ATPase [Mesoplasma photuris]
MKIIEEYNKTALTDNDLNDYKKLINEFHHKLAESKAELSIAKEKYAKLEVEKDEVKKIKAEVSFQKNEIAKIANSNPFVLNFENAKKLIKMVKSENNNAEIDEEAINAFVKAKQLLKESKISIQDKGRGIKLEKNNDIAIKVSNLSFKYAPDFPYALNNVNFEIKHGEYVTIIGHNGSGKSTLSKIFIGVLKPEEGSYEIFGNKVHKNNLDQIRKFLGIVFQNPDNQFIGSTVQADIAFGLENKRVEPHLMPEIILEAAKKVRMENFLDKEPLNLSGGQKQRVAIASALALNPEILIFDEATSMLDPKGNREIKEIMVDLRNQGNKTIISITHDMDEILNADKVIVMNGGKMVQIGTPEEVLKDKDFLRSIKLDIPFVGTVEEALAEQGITVNHSKDMKELVDQLCK